jgi:hypothetical protein
MRQCVRTLRTEMAVLELSNLVSLVPFRGRECGHGEHCEVRAAAIPYNDDVNAEMQIPLRR